MPRFLTYIAKSLWPDDTTLRQERFYLFLSAALLALAWPPLPFGFLAHIALIKPLEIISGKSFGKGFKQGYFFYFFYACFSLYWIAWVTIPGTLAAIAITSLYPAFILGLYAAVYRWKKFAGLIALPFLWVGMEYFRTQLEIAFPWSNLSYTQGSYLPLLQICEYVGDVGVSFLIVVINILLWQAWKQRRAVYAVTAGVLVIAPIIYGSVLLRDADKIDSGPLYISLLQGGLTIEEKWDPKNRDYNFYLYDSLAQASVRDTSGGHVQFVCWPETSAPAYLLNNFRYTSLVARTAQRIGVPMLVGTLDAIRYSEDSVETFNAAFQFDPDGSHRRAYHKSKLVPFAETVPYGNYIPWLANLSLGWSDFVHGRGPVVYRNEFGNYGTLICYEVIFPEVVNEYVRQGADFLVNITNDAWYGYSSGPYQHAGMAPFRAIENRICIARATNSGFSYFTDRYGRIYNKLGLYEKGYVSGHIQPVEGRTVFNRTGPVIGRIGLLLIGIVSTILGIAWIRQKFGSSR